MVISTTATVVPSVNLQSLVNHHKDNTMSWFVQKIPDQKLLNQQHLTFEKETHIWLKQIRTDFMLSTYLVKVIRDKEDKKVAKTWY